MSSQDWKEKCETLGEIIAVQDESLKQLKEINEIMHAEIKQKTSECINLKKKNHDLELKVKHCEEKYHCKIQEVTTTKEEEINELKKTNEQLKNEKNSKAALIQQLDKELSACKQDLLREKESVAMLKRPISDATEKKEQHLNEKESLVESKRELVKELIACKEDLFREKEKALKLHEQISNDQRTIQGLLEEKDAVLKTQNLLETQISEDARKLEQLSKEKEALIDTKLFLETEVRRRSLQKTALKSAKTKNKNLRRINKDLTTKVNELELQDEQNRAELDRLRRCRDELQRSVIDLGTRLVAIQQQAPNNQAVPNQLREIIDGLRGRLSSITGTSMNEQGGLHLNPEESTMWVLRVEERWFRMK